MLGFMTLTRAALVLCGLWFPVSGAAQDGISYELTDGRSVAPFERFRECDLCPEMIAMPLGSFMMGAKLGESRNRLDIFGKNATGRVRDPDEVHIMPAEHPRHRVKMDIPFAIGRNEVTRAEWMACVEGGGCTHVPDDRDWRAIKGGGGPLGPQHPVMNVSYLDAQQYVAWLNVLVGTNAYRLPTEAEWEYAARAGTTTRFAQGDELTSDQANFLGRVSRTAEGEKIPGLIDRTGWCRWMHWMRRTLGGCGTCRGMCTR